MVYMASSKSSASIDSLVFEPDLLLRPTEEVEMEAESASFFDIEEDAGLFFLRLFVLLGEEVVEVATSTEADAGEASATSLRRLLRICSKIRQTMVISMLSQRTQQ